jgi:hypothetical protein
MRRREDAENAEAGTGWAALPKKATVEMEGRAYSM